MPPLPEWHAAHPLVVHFPVALLLISPVLILLAVLWRPAWKPLAIAALIVVLAGAAGTVLAVMSGEAGEDAAKAVPAAHDAFERHEELGELARNIFLGLAALFAVIVAITVPTKPASRFGRRVFVIASLVYLLPFLAGAVVLAKTAHEGGLLVHFYGVRAPILPEGAPALPRPAVPDDDD